MEYLVYYSNGEEGYLSHSGVKGMKWGVWNAETAAKYSTKAKVGHRIETSKKNQQFSDKALDYMRKRDSYISKGWNAKHLEGNKKKADKYKAKENKYQKKLDDVYEKWNNADIDYGKQSAYYKAKAKQVDKIAKEADGAVARYKADPTKQNEKAARIAENRRNMAQLDLMGTKTSRDNIRYSNIKNAYGAERNNGRTYYRQDVEKAAKFRRRLNMASTTLGLVGGAAYMAAAKQGREAYTRYLKENSRIG